MAVRHLPVLTEHDRDPLRKPRTRGDCIGGVRPCPFVTCRFNLLVDVLEDGMTVINAPSRRIAGASRAIPSRHDAIREWYVIVRLPPNAATPFPRTTDGPAVFALGPCGSAPRARTIAKAWAAEHGPNTARWGRNIPEQYRSADPLQEGKYDRLWLDEVEDAVDYWFDEPDPKIPSCVLDEITNLDRDDEERLLEEIAVYMHISRERVRQVEASALAKLKSHGITLNDFLDQD